MTDLKHTPLEAAHLRLQARMVPFAGWYMPVQYSGITAEHEAVRKGVGVFDISHMGQVFVTGAGAEAWLNGLLTNNVSKLEPGQGQYTLMLNEEGGVIDDLIAYRTGPADFVLVINASMIDEDVAWMQAHLPADVVLRNASSDYAGLAVQGPRASELLDGLPPRNGIQLRLDGVIVCRTGYTGEDGFELFCPAADGEKWLDRFVAAGATPCGLGARDTLRLEMCYPLNGNDLSPTRTPIEAGLGFFVDLTKTAFTGHEKLRAQKASGDHDKLCALVITEKGPPPRAHYPVVLDGVKIGETCSGGPAPSLGGQGIALAYLPAAHAKPGTIVGLEVRGKVFAAKVVKKPFYKKA